MVDEQDPSITNGIKLEWDAVEGAVSYNLYRALQSEPSVLIAEHVAGTSYVDISLQPGARYTYTVKPCFADRSEGGAIGSGKDAAVTTGAGQIPQLADGSGVLGVPKSYILMQIDNPNMDVNGTPQEVDPGRGTAPIARYSRTVLPIRAVVEAMGGTVGWDRTQNRVTLAANGSSVEMWIGNMAYRANGADLTMDIAPFAENERTFLPLRFAAENLNCRVTWRNATQEILIVFNGEAKTNEQGG